MIEVALSMEPMPSEATAKTKERAEVPAQSASDQILF
jgi:hypothetical protein